MYMPLIVSISLSTIFLIVMVIFLIVRIRACSKSCVYTVKGKQVIVRFSMRRGGQLFVNGVLEEQFRADRTSHFTLRTMLDGEEFKAHISIAFSVSIEAYYRDALLTPDSVGK